jgi:hypothetical protein
MRSLHHKLAAIVALGATGPACAQNCFFAADFEAAALPAGWESSIASIPGTGESTSAWTLGNSAEANAGGFFPVPDAPIGNRFAMANDDAAPCDCDLQLAVLASPTIDLTSRTRVALRYRVFNEGVLGGGPALVEASPDGTDWVRVDSIEAVAGEWQARFIDLAPFDGSASFRFRIRWSDNGGWASGLAIDDICLFERLQVDLAITHVYFNAPSESPFDLSVRSLPYTLVPLEQASGMRASVEVENRGTAALNGIQAAAAASLNGTSLGSAVSSGLPSLAPGQRAVLVFPALPTPPATGSYGIDVSATSSGPLDEAPANNAGAAAVLITGAGWADGYGAMALDSGTVQGRMGSAAGFIAATRFELANAGSVAHGISARLAFGTEVGALVRGILLRENFSLVDTTERHVVTQEDLDDADAGGFIYFPFAGLPALSAADYLIGFQRLSTGGDAYVATSGTCKRGSTALLTGTTFDLEWTRAVPMVRLHMSDYGVGLSEHPAVPATGLVIAPSPLSGHGVIGFDLEVPATCRLELLDGSGRLLAMDELGVLPAGAHRLPLDAQALPPGLYIAKLQAGATVLRKRFIAVH